MVNITLEYIDDLERYWISQTFELVSTLDVQADLKVVAGKSLMFFIGKYCPLALLFSHGENQVSYDSTKDGKLEKVKIPCTIPDWKVLVPKVIESLKIHKNNIDFK